MKLFDKLSAAAKLELLKDAGVFDKLEDLQKSVHSMSLDELKALEEEIQNVIQEHNKQLISKDLPYEPTSLDEFEFADDMEAFASIADNLDKQGCYEAAEVIDGLIEHLAKKSSEPGRADAKSIREMRKSGNKSFFFKKADEWEDDPTIVSNTPDDKAFNNHRRIMKEILEDKDLRQQMRDYYEQQLGRKLQGDEELKKLLNDDETFWDLARKTASFNISKRAQTPDWMPKPLTQQQITPPATQQQMPAPYQPAPQQAAKQPAQQPAQGDTSGLTPQQISSINKIQNPGLRSQWINKLKRDNMTRQPVAPQQAPKSLPVQPATPQPAAQQPAPQQVQQPARKPFNYNQWEQNMGFQQQQPEDEDIKQAFEGAEIKVDDE